MRTGWNPESPSLLPAIICYADILGFREETGRALKSGEGNEYLRRIKHSLAAVYENAREHATPGSRVEIPIFEVKVFTDNIVVAYPLRDPGRDFGEPELGTLLTLFADAQASLAADGFFLRGAITAGKHYQDQDIVYGDALLEAANLDKSGTPPRLVIGSSVEPLILQHLSLYRGITPPHHHDLLEDPQDGRLFVNYLAGAFDFFPYGPINHPLLATHSNQVSSNLQKHKSDLRVWPKYAWIAIYHNYVCRTFADHFRVRNYEEPDPEEATHSAQAQRVLDHLVPFNVEDFPVPFKAEDFPDPRPLDAERLQERLAAG